MNLILVPPFFKKARGDRVFRYQRSSSPETIYFGDHNVFVRISQTLALLEEGMPKGEGFGYDISSKDT